MNWGNLLFSFQGRINRAKYWLSFLIWIVAWAVVIAAVIATKLSVAAIMMVVILMIPSFISWIAIGIKRLHDRDKSGWWLLLFYLTPAVMDGIGRASGIGFIFSLAGFVISIWAFVELGCLRGTAGQNRYGSDPLAAAA
jgi:uncharacterized membrane protein YhaH (DUF805 family)